MRLKNLAAIFLALSFVVFSQKVEVPKDVTNAFSKLYPNVSTVKWDKEGKNEFEAAFKENGKETTVTFESNGKVVEIEMSITEKELPEGIESYIAKNYAGFKITESAKITDSKGVVTFEAEITKGKLKHDLMFDNSGKFLEKKGKANDEEDED
jgi:uncharacterized cupredoxin-like copper-binding protein